MKLCTGQAAASPRAQIVCPSILLATSTSNVEVRLAALAFG